MPGPASAAAARREKLERAMPVPAEIMSAKLMHPRKGDLEIKALADKHARRREQYELRHPIKPEKQEEPDG